MNKKGLIVLIFSVAFVLFLASFAFAAENTTTNSIDDAYKCLRNQTSGKTLSLKEAVFTTLALGGQENFNKVEALKDTNSCWPKGACTLKETAQALLAYRGVGQNTDAIKNWILTKNTTTNELKWLLQIDISNKVRSVCTIKDGRTPGTTSTITILGNSQIQGTPGSCFTLDQGNYMLRVNPSCLRNEFEISCDQDFVTSILYQKATGGTLFILPEAHSAASLGSTKEKINGECLRTGTGGLCDYEGTLWGALVLQKVEVDISRFTPYLLALADDNNRYFPSAFLYALVGGDDQYDLIIQQQKQGKFWEITGAKDGRYYDTSLAMLSLADRTEIDSTKEYLLSIQTKDGCWNNNNIRDTAFILYSGWPRNVASTGAASSSPCEAPSYSCENLIACTNAGGTTVDLECPNALQFCCTVAVREETCSEKEGLLCSSGQDCTGGTFGASADGPCCIGGTCEDVQQAEDTCTPNGGTCKATCNSDEESSVETCSIGGETCCVVIGGGSGWIIILIILIVLAAIGIIFRNKLKMWWYKIAEKFRKKPEAQATRPMSPGQQSGSYPRQMTQQRPMNQAMPARQIRPVAKDKEMEEALKKLRDMARR